MKILINIPELQKSATVKRDHWTEADTSELVWSWPCLTLMDDETTFSTLRQRPVNCSPRGGVDQSWRINNGRRLVRSTRGLNWTNRSGCKFEMLTRIFMPILFVLWHQFSLKRASLLKSCSILNLNPGATWDCERVKLVAKQNFNVSKMTVSAGKLT